MAAGHLGILHSFRVGRPQPPPDIRRLRFRHLAGAGFDGVILLGCKYGDDYQCHFIKGSELASVREKNVREKLEQMAMDLERVEMHEIQISDYEKLPKIFENFAELIEEIGMNPFKGM